MVQLPAECASFDVYKKKTAADGKVEKQKPEPGTGIELPVPSLEKTVAGTVARIFEAECYQITNTVDSISDGMTRRFRNGFNLSTELLPVSTTRELEAYSIGFDDLSPTDAILVDIETTGLLSSPLFLIGLLVMTHELEVHQYFARNYAEEAAVIQLFLKACRGKKLLISFNGRTFDLPYIRARAAATGVPFDVELVHLDLLHVGRRIWGDRLPDCRLQTIERHICGRTRTGDIPGAFIPEAYHEYVRSGNAAQMARVIDHNMHDLVTLADIMIRIR